MFLDANENPYNQPFNRYPDPLQLELKEAIAKVKGVPARNIFLGNGSDEAIDPLFLQSWYRQCGSHRTHLRHV